MTTSEKTPFRIMQSEEYHGDDWWDWSVWLDGPKEALDRVKYVEYTLHPTFPKPVREESDRTSNFRLSSAGWGTFTVHVNVVQKDGQKIRLKHELSLHYPDGSETAL
jgi:transcription initiation factor IIF auxiliary subunit